VRSGDSLSTIGPGGFENHRNGHRSSTNSTATPIRIGQPPDDPFCNRRRETYALSRRPAVWKETVAAALMATKVQATTSVRDTFWDIARETPGESRETSCLEQHGTRRTTDLPGQKLRDLVAETPKPTVASC